MKNAANTITSLKATGGNVMLADDMTVQRISAANGKSVSVAMTRASPWLVASP